MGKVKIAASVTPNRTKFGPLLYPGELPRAVRELSEFGYDGIELSLRTAEDTDLADLARQLESAGMELLSIATGQSCIEDGYSLFNEDRESRAASVRRIRDFIDIVGPQGNAVILGGIRGSLTAPAGTRERERQYADGCAAVDECLEYAQKRGAILLLEAINRYETNLFNTVGSCCEFAAERNSPHLRVLADSFHMNIEEVSMEGAIEAAGPLTGVIHCADSNRLAPGMGHTDFARLLEGCETLSGLLYLGVEVLPLPDSRTCADQAITTLKRILEQER
jgi:5-keto-L-gluconate epimerase